MRVELFGTDDDARMREAVELRIEVFVHEQGVPLAEEIDEHDRGDAKAVHALARDENGRAIAAGRFYERDEDTVQIGRMAVRSDARRRGAGRTILEALMGEARRRGYAKASLSAQLHAREFYAKAGFAAEGLLFRDAGIEHQEMERNL